MATTISMQFHSTFPLQKRARKFTPLIVAVNNSHKLNVPFDLKHGQNRKFHKLPSGLGMEVIVQKGVKRSEKDEQSARKLSDMNPPLVFVHGSYHAAWCWAEHWLPFFSGRGFDCYAVSLLGQGESDAPTGTVAGSLVTHAGDVADFIRKELKSPPVLIGHSSGGLIVQRYIAFLKSKQTIELEGSYTELAGAVLLCSTPPSGNSEMAWRFLLSKPVAAFKVTYSLAAKGFQNSVSLCKETFFSASMDNNSVARYRDLMKASSRMPLFDLRNLNKSLPVPSIPKSSIDLLVLGAENDFIVDAEGLDETGQFYGIAPVCVEGVAHDMMLDCSWDKGARVIWSWLNSLPE